MTITTLLETGVLGIVLLAVLPSGAQATPMDPPPSRTTEQFSLSDTDQTLAGSTASRTTANFEVRAGFAVAEGDILLGYADALPEQPSDIRQRGLGRNSKFDRWTDGLVYYHLEDSLEINEREKVTIAIAHWNNQSSITMVERTSELEESVTDYINFEPSTGCASWVGKIGGAQALWVGPECTAGSVIHEIGHAIGLFHEHTREDRNNFITIQTENITPGKEFNFDIIFDGVDPVGDYDYGSVMHYGESFFSSNGQPTILVPDGVTIGQRDGLSSLDKATIDIMYGTDLSLYNAVTTNSDASKTVSVAVTNNSTSGAHDLVYSLQLQNNEQIMSVDGNGWNCQTSATSLDCRLWQLQPADSSLLDITLTGAQDAIIETAYLSSKTFDTDLSNNGQPAPPGNQPTESAPETSDEAMDPAPTVSDSEAEDPPATEPDATVVTPESVDAEPEPTDMQENSETKPAASAAKPAVLHSAVTAAEASAADDGGGGSMSWLLPAWLVLRRRSTTQRGH